MSYDVELVYEESNELASVERHQEGANIVVGGSTTATMSVTYNYAIQFGRIDGFENDGLKWLNGKQAAETISVLEAGVALLGEEPTPSANADYWEGSAGNAGHALNVLLGWAREHPEAVWYVT